MNIKRFISIALIASTAIVLMPETSAYSRNTKSKKSKLTRENELLKLENAELNFEIKKLKQELHRTDSMTNELLEFYEGKDENAITEEFQDIEYTQEVSDSLLNIWYTHRAVNDLLEQEWEDSVRFESNVPDSVYVERIKRMNSFITLPYNDIVRGYIVRYSEKMPATMPKILALCEYYMPIFEETFNKYDLPEELKVMAIIESAMNPLAVSKVSAKGMWQFMYQTAKMYNLHIDSFVDERLDPVKSADAAARYLRDAYNIFGDWNLAIASYNCGAGNVNKAIRRSGSRKFWDIWPFLPKETRGYVPAFVGALYTINYYKEHGIKPECVQMPVHVDTFQINKMLHLKQVSELTGAPLEELKNLNPQYRHEIIPGNEREYILRIPFQYTNAFIDNEAKMYTHNAETYFNPVTIKKIKEGGDGERIVYKVKSGDYLGKIAEKYRCSVASIKRWNDLKSNNIRVGQRLVIYRGGKAPASSSSSSKSSSKSTSQQTKQSTSKPKVSASGEYVTYTVKSGDSFYSIAKDYPGISAKNIMEYNGLDSSKIRPGMKIKIPLKM